MNLQGMIVSVLHARFHDPRTPVWFQDRVRAQVLFDIPKGIMGRDLLRDTIRGICLVVAFMVIGHFSPPWWRTAMNVLAVWFAALILLPTLIDIFNGCRALGSGSTRYRDAIEQVQESLTAHERLDYVVYTGQGGPT